MNINHETFVVNHLRALGLEEVSLCWDDADKKVGTFFLTLERPVIDKLHALTRKGEPLYHPVQRKEKSEAQRERYVPAMNNGWWEDYASSIAFVVYPDAKGVMQFKLADGYQRTASSLKARPPRPLKFIGVVHICASETESSHLIRHYNLGQAKTPDDNIRGARAFDYVHPKFAKSAKVISTRIRYWNANAKGQILPEEWEKLSAELELPLKAFERMVSLVRSTDVEDFEAAAIESGLGGTEIHTVYARLVGLLYQANDHDKAKKYCELVLQNRIPSVEPRLLVGESLNTISKMVMDAYAMYCDPSYEVESTAKKKDWAWGEYVPPVRDWPVFVHSTQ